MQAKISNKAIVFHVILCFFYVGFITLWKPLGCKLSTKLEHNTKRIYGHAGLFFKIYMEAPISKISSVAVVQSLFGRMLNYGTVYIKLTGNSAEYIFEYIDNPNAFRNSIMELIEDNK